MTVGEQKSALWYYVSGALKRWQRDDYATLPTGTGNAGSLTEFNRRNAIAGGVYGVTKPTLSDVGVYPGVTRTAFNASNTTKTYFTTPNVTYQNLDIYGDCYIRAANVTFQNCYFYGGSGILTAGNTGVIDCNGSAVVNAKFLDCTINPQLPSYYRDGIVGHEYTAERCYVTRTNDGFGAFANPNYATNNCNVTIKGCYTDVRVYWANDPEHNDGTHNDGIQYQGGSNVLIQGNVVIGSTIPAIWNSGNLIYGAPWTPSNPSIEPYQVWQITGVGEGSNKKDDANNPDLIVNNQAHGSCVILQDNVKKGTSNVVLDGNWLDRGLAQLNVKPGTYTITNNRFGRNGYWYNANSKYTMRVDSRSGTTFTGGLGTNVWEDDGVVLTEGLLTGIRYNS